MIHPRASLYHYLGIISGSIVLISCAYLVPKSAHACTSMLVTKGASEDGSTMITYAADAHDLYGELYFTDRARHKPGTKRQIRDWDSLKPLGYIDQPAQTFRTVGNINEHQVAIAESTFGGHKQLRDPNGGIDYGSMMYIALERAKTAREAIHIMTTIANDKGYYSKGESFSIADPNEVWLMEMIGKGPNNKGVVWVACKVPDGFVTVHANQPRIRTFVQDDPNQCIYAPDVISFARENGLFAGSNSEFSFVKAYATETCEDLRTTDARVWSFFHRIAPSQGISPDAPLCKPGAQPLPLWIKPDRKLRVQDLMAAMRDHFEDTPFDMRGDVGAGPFALPYRWRPLRWVLNGKTYSHQRATATQQTAFSLIAQMRSWLPGPIGGLLWFGVDDAASTVYVPMYAGINSVPKPYAVGTASFNKFSWNSAFWVFNGVANFAYTRYSDTIVDIRNAQQQLEEQFFQQQQSVESKAQQLFATSPSQASVFLTQYSHQAANTVMDRWKQLGPELLMKYMDGNVRDASGKVTHPAYRSDWYARIVAETNNHLLIADEPLESATAVHLASTHVNGAARSPSSLTSDIVRSASHKTSEKQADSVTLTPPTSSTESARRSNGSRGCFIYPCLPTNRSSGWITAITLLFVATLLRAKR